MTPNKIKSLKEASGLTWAEFADAVGASHSVVKKWLYTGKNSRKPSRANLIIMHNMQKSLKK